jgi:hypothetical protein
MGEITRRGYRIEWFIGDHGRGTFMSTIAKGDSSAGFDIQEMRGIEGWKPSESW